MNKITFSDQPALREGDRVTFVRRLGVVTNVDPTTITIRPVRWYERLWDWVTFLWRRVFR